MKGFTVYYSIITVVLFKQKNCQLLFELANPQQLMYFLVLHNYNRKALPKTRVSMAKIRPKDQKESYPKEITSMKSFSQIFADCGVKVSNSTISRVLNESETITRQSLMTMPRSRDYAKKNLQTNWSQVSKYFYFFMYSYYN